MGRIRIDTLLRQAQDAFNANELSRASAICEQILQLNGRHNLALNLLGQIAFARGDYGEAETQLLKAVTIQPRDARSHLVLGEVKSYQGQYREALGRYDKVLRLEPNHPRAIAGKADAYEKSGQRDKARAVLAPFVEDGQDTPEMAIVQARLELSARNFDDLVDLVNRHIHRGEIAPFTLWHLYSLLGKALERSGRFDEAFDAYEQGNRTVPSPFNAESWRQRADDLIAAFSAERLPTLPRAANDSQLPVFIVGMPRSGSTLIESILDAHPRVHTAGEFTALPEIVNGIALQIGSMLPWPACVEDFAQEDVDELARAYLDRLTAVDTAADRIADKFLPNYRQLGLIELLFPAARVIHCRRHPLDTCLSCFCETLFPAAHPYTTDLKRLGLVYVTYERIMAHWREVLTIPILDVQYEQLVADQERLSRDIIEFCGLEWDDRCLRFYDTGRVFRTASYDQVNRPIYRSSVGRYRNFERHLEPLKTVLAEGGLSHRLAAPPG